MKSGYRSIPLLIAILTLCACIEREVPEATIEVKPTETVLPTPTLMPGLPTPTEQFDVPTAAAEATKVLQTPTPLPPATRTPVPTLTPQPGERVDFGSRYLEQGNYAAAADQFLNALVAGSVTPAERLQAVYGLSIAQYKRGQFQAAADGFRELLASGLSSGGSQSPGFQGAEAADQLAIPVADAYYFLAQLSLLEGDCQAALGALQSYLASNPEMSSYILPEMAACYSTLNDPLAAIEAYETAVNEPALPGKNIALRLELARQYLSQDNYPEALAQYLAAAEMAATDDEKGKVNYLIGSTLIGLEEYEEAYRYYQEAVANYPSAFESYLALSALIEVGEPVDDFNRGVVDFYAQAYQPAVEVLSRYVEGNEPHNEEAHLYEAWSYEGLGLTAEALAQIDAYIAAASEAEPEGGPEDELPEAATDLDPAHGWMERARLQARNGNLQGAIADYHEILTSYPDSADAPLAAWWAAAYAERLGLDDAAIEGYELLANNYPDHFDAAEALFRAGLLAHVSGDDDRAAGIWQQAVDQYLAFPYGAASLIWLIRSSSEDPDQFSIISTDIPGADYYQIRARRILSGGLPFEPAESIDLVASEGERQEAETWLRGKVGLESSVSIGDLSPDLAQDGSLLRGTKLLRLGRWQEGKEELESLRRAYSGDAVASYQLALAFRELGLYRSSILAAVNVLRLTNTEVFDAPPYIGKLAYPTYYSDLVEMHAANYGYDPLLQFALIRQESLFESFARSGAVAQGLSQVIPETGEYIAQKLNWPDYVNEDLYKPYVGIAFGAYYLDEQLQAFENDVAAALSAYNAGPGNASRWFAEAPHDLDLYREIVDFNETREYIDRIYEGQAIYRFLYGQD